MLKTHFIGPNLGSHCTSKSRSASRIQLNVCCIASSSGGNIRRNSSSGISNCSPNESSAFSASGMNQMQSQQDSAIPATMAQDFVVESTDFGGGHGNDGSPPHDGNDRWGDSGEPPSKGVGLGPLALLLRGVRGRLEADPYFGTKLLIECGLDAAIITGANIIARKERFWRELEFTFCHLAISLLSDFGLVYLLAPSTARPPPVTGSLRARLKLNLLPAHVFQISPSGAAPFTARARLATFVLKGVQYGAVGLCMGSLGAACVHALIHIRESLDPNFIPPKRVQSILGTGAVWSGFMATSSNIRYNALTVLEDIMYMKGPGMGKAGSFALRLINNWAGAAQWVAVTSVHSIEEEWKPKNPRLAK